MEAMEAGDQSQDGAIKNTGHQDELNANSMQSPARVNRRSLTTQPQSFLSVFI